MMTNKKQALFERLENITIQNWIDRENQVIEKNSERRLYKFKSRMHKHGLFLDEKQPSPIKKFITWLTASLLVTGPIVYATVSVSYFDQLEPIACHQPAQVSDDLGAPESFAGFKQFIAKFSTHYESKQDEVISQMDRSDCNVVYLAEQYNPNALFNMGLMYQEGLEVVQDYQKAYEYYKRASALGNTKATFNMNYLIEENLAP
jgi:hypothetical protein